MHDLSFSINQKDGVKQKVNKMRKKAVRVRVHF